MTGITTTVTELGTALGMLVSDGADPLGELPRQFRYVSADEWERFTAAARGEHTRIFLGAFENGRHFFRSIEGLRSREPVVVEWKGPHRPPGDEVAPIDLRVDHVFLVGCKYVSRVLLNAGPFRLFDRLMVGEERGQRNWFAEVAPAEYEQFFQSVREVVPGVVAGSADLLTPADRLLLKSALTARLLPEACRRPWAELTRAVSEETARRWSANLRDPKDQLRLLWRMLRIVDGPYFVLGHDGSNALRLRIASKWDWLQEYELRGLDIAPRHAGQAEVGWRARISRRADGAVIDIDGHVEIRWSHGRLQGAPEAKVYLDSPHDGVPGYSPLH